MSDVASPTRQPMRTGVTNQTIDVVILTWNDGELLAKAIDSAVRATSELDVNIVVVDNASGPPAEVPDLPNVRLVRNTTNRGVAGGRNDGMVATSSPLVCFLDSDAELHPDSLTALLEALTSDEKIAMAVPVFSDQAPEASAGIAPGLRTKIRRVRDADGLYESVDHGDEKWWDVEFGIGACQLFRRAAFDSVGGLDESLYWAEDVDFCLRVIESGNRIVQVGTTRVDHPPRRRFRKPLSKRGLQHTWAVLRYVVRHRRW